MSYNYFTGMFGTSGTNSSNGMWNIYNSMGDLSSIKSGSYKKLLSAYYKNNTKDSTAKNSVSSAIKNKNNTTVSQTMTEVKKKTDALTKAAETLMDKGKDSVFAKEDKKEMVSAVKDFVTAYNNTLTEAEKASSDVSSKAVYMTNSTKAYEKSLGEIGITIGEDNKLTVDEEKLTSADSTKVKSLFNSSSSFVGQTARKAAKIGAAAQNAANGVGTYSSKGTYNYQNMSNYFNSFF